MAEKTASGLPAPKQGRMHDTVARVAAELRQAIIEGRLLPGERIRQEALAGQLDVSKVPVREALKTLAANGMLEYTMNSGFSVARLNEGDLGQLYRMRALIEDDLMDPLPPIDASIVTVLAELNDQMRTAARGVDIASLIRLNHQFHFEIFGLAGKKLTVEILSRLWDLSAPYHSTYLYDTRARENVIQEHDAIVSALEEGDTKRYRDVMAAHRDASEVQLLRVLRVSRPFLPLAGR